MEVADAGQGDVHELVHELVHALTAEGHLGADVHALAQLEVGDGLLGLGGDGLLAGDGLQLLDGGFQRLGVILAVAQAHVNDDLVDLRDLVDVLVTELLLEGRNNFGHVLIIKTRFHL